MMGLPSMTIAAITDDYELTVEVVKMALRGWELHQSGKHLGEFADGQYSDTRPATRARDFWSNGRYATLDRDENGHAETVFTVVRGELVYVGSLGRTGRFVDASQSFAECLGKTKNELVRERAW
jgi:hypothetical protein